MRPESLAAKESRTKKIIGRLKKTYPDSHCSLNFKTVHQLMVATILSAQCTDDRVNKVTPGLFAKYRSVKAFASADLEELKKDVYPTGFYANKAKAILGSAKLLVKSNGGRVPQTMEELIKLPGVGRKTASVILGVGFNKAEGVVVDTHVGRISRLLRLTAEKEAVKVENDLMVLIPKTDWIVFSHLMIDHGRAVCVARRPDCGACRLRPHCPSGLKSEISINK